ncbi:MAG: gliding motility-associated C-terminal domain-containing protein, partial [Bacteroidia bacterium]|nr:gliding motility-associated C-terminal domain-containing protein [Bacteroidia bacterium]
QWDLGDLSSSLTVSPVHTYAAGTYTATLITTSNFTCSDTATATILVNALPSNIVTASGPLQFCQGDSVLLSAITGGFNYLWNTAATTQTITVSTTGNFDVTITDTLTGCSNASDLVSTTMFPTPIVFAGNDTSISLGSSYTLNAVGIGIISWAWFPNTGLNNATISNPMASPTETSTYQVIGTDINGCSDFDSITITVIADFNVTVSNLMTPNGDGYNDRWIIGNLENYPDTEVMVINREGQVMYQNANYDNNWDGTNKNGKKLSDGTYYYIIKFKDSDKLYKGSITVIRDTDRR